MSMEDIYLITGSNQGERWETLMAAKAELEEGVGPLVAESAVYETAPWGKTDQPAFLNQVLHFRASILPADLLQLCLRIERKHGRKRRVQWDARTLDIDILFFGQQVIIEEDLIVPHPHLHERRFVLEPMNSLASEWIHPVMNLSVRRLLELCNDKLPVHVYSPSGNSSIS